VAWGDGCQFRRGIEDPGNRIEWTVGKSPAGAAEGTNIRFAAEMAKVLDDRPNLRVLPMVTYGALGNVEDLLSIKGVDDRYPRRPMCSRNTSANGTLANIKNRIRYICSFYINECNVYVRPEIKKDTRGSCGQEGKLPTPWGVLRT